MKLLKHPLFLLLVTTALGSVLIPYVTAKVEANRRLLDQKNQMALRILQSALDVDRKFNSLSISFADIGRDVAAGRYTPTAYETARTNVGTQYRDLDQIVWWWHWQVVEEASILHLIDDHNAELNQSAHCYQDNVAASIEDLQPLFREFIDRPYRRTTPGTSKRILDAVSEQLNKHYKERKACVRQMANAVLH